MGLFSWRRKDASPARTLEEKVAALSETHIIGVVQLVGERLESKSFYMGMNANDSVETVRAFRVHVQYEDGAAKTYSIEMRGKRFSGNLMDGDIVAVPNDKIREGKVTKLSEIRNLTAGDVRVRSL